MKHLLSILTLLAFIATSAWTDVAERVQVIPTPNGGFVPDAEIDSAGVIHLAYVSGDDLYYVKSTDWGKSFSPPIRVNSEAGSVYGGGYRGPDLAVGRDGQIHIVWYTNAYQRKLPKDQWGVLYSHLNADGTTFVPGRNLNRIPSDNYALAVDEKGTVAVFWMAGRVYLTLSDDAGETFNPKVEIDEPDPCECCASRAYFSESGGLYFAYRDKAENMRDMFLLMRPAGQATFSREKLSKTPWQLDACPMTGTYLTGDSGGHLAAGWETKGQVYFARLDATGHRIARGEILVARRGKYPVVLTASDGISVVAWKNDSKLEWQIYDASGKLQGVRGSAAVDNVHRPTGVVTQAGDFLLFP